MRKIVFTGINKVELVKYKLSALLENRVRVRHLYSLISAGTEKLMLSGVMGLPFDMQPGYCAVDEIMEGWEWSGFTKGNIVFTHGIHADTMDVPIEWAKKIFIPINREFCKEGTFLQLGKVALHGLRKVRIGLGEWVVVFGLGVIGNLCSQLARLASANRVLQSIIHNRHGMERGM